jgi:hypothetical protein
MGGSTVYRQGQSYAILGPTDRAGHYSIDQKFGTPGPTVQDTETARYRSSVRTQEIPNPSLQPYAQPRRPNRRRLATVTTKSNMKPVHSMPTTQGTDLPLRL